MSIYYKSDYDNGICTNDKGNNIIYNREILVFFNETLV